MGFQLRGRPTFAPKGGGECPPLGERWNMPSAGRQSPRIHKGVPVIEFMIFVCRIGVPVIITPGRPMLIPGSLPFRGAFHLWYGVAVPEMACVQVRSQPYLLSDLDRFISISVSIGRLRQKIAGYDQQTNERYKISM